MSMRRYIAFSLFLVFASPAWAAGGVVLKMATTTSTENSGLLDVLIPAFTEDVVFVHARKREERFVAEGYGAYRLGVMHNDFVILGPGRDPAGIKGMSQAALAFRKIAETRSHFVSRGDDSGTHTKEQALWRASGVHLSRKTTEIFRKGKKRTLTFLYPGGLGRWYQC